ncbi:unnamed protein product [Owenia fusiformis]|uniref:Hydroxylysine kinase n=1 Tax=Owenia fusiformis TaxID=6347 RepID=A0A8J1TUE0_OWEFU|nr:unnamed protein product [Owenia fusiformis]
MDGSNEKEAELKPGQVIKPQMNENVAKNMVRILFGMEVTSIKEMASYDDRNYYVKVKEDHNNNNIEKIWPHGYTLKVTNSMESVKAHIDAEHGMQRLLHSNDIPCPLPVLNVQGTDRTLQVIYTPQSKEEGWMKTPSEGGDRPFNRHTVRLLTFIPGETLFNVPYTPHLFHSAGVMLGRINKLFKDTNFNHAAFDDYTSLWNLASTPQLSKFVYAVTDPDNHALIEEVLTAFEAQVPPHYDKLTKGTIHGDYNEQNLLVTPSSLKPDTPVKEYDVCGVLDFQDAAFSYFVFDVAIGICYLMIECQNVDPLDVGGHFLAGYLSEMSLNESEFEVLKICVASRFAQSLVMGAYSYSLDPGNEYLLVTQENGWKKLKILWPVSQDALYTRWKNIIDSYKK